MLNPEWTRSDPHTDYNWVIILNLYSTHFYGSHNTRNALLTGEFSSELVQHIPYLATNWSKVNLEAYRFKVFHFIDHTNKISI